MEQLLLLLRVCDETIKYEFGTGNVFDIRRTLVGTLRECSGTKPEIQRDPGSHFEYVSEGRSLVPNTKLIRYTCRTRTAKTPIRLKLLSQDCPA